MEQVGPSMDGAGWCRAGGSIAKPISDNSGLIDECTCPHGLVGGKPVLAPTSAISMAYSERAMKLLTKVIEDYPRRTGPSTTYWT